MLLNFLNKGSPTIPKLEQVGFSNAYAYVRFMQEASDVSVDPLGTAYTLNGMGNLLNKRKRADGVVGLLRDNPRLAALTANNFKNSVEINE